MTKVIILTLPTTQKACGISPACYKIACWISASFEQSGKEDIELKKAEIKENILLFIMCEK